MTQAETTPHSHPHITPTMCCLSELADPATLSKFQQRTGLADFYWQVLYDISDSHEQTMAEAIKQAEGYVFFLHGWDGSHRIWEDLPVRLMLNRKGLVCFSPDVNGFGQSPFINYTPEPALCCPIGMMTAIEQWLATMDLWPVTGRERKPFFLFVGHSMGGAALFYKDEAGWQDETYGIYAIAPALLCNDVQHQTFYKALGLGIGLPSFAFLKKRLAPRVIDILGGGASNFVKQEHVRIFTTTPFGTLAQTIYAMGALATKPERNDWPRFQVALGNRDRLVGLPTMLDLLEGFGLRADQLRVTFGDHYFFSYDNQSPQAHRYNREVILADLLTFCDRLSQEAKTSS